MNAKPRAMIVDDETNLTTLLVRAFRHEGFEVATAGNGIECMNKMKGFAPDVVVMDIMMPRLDGIDATRLIRRHPEFADTLVVALTARTDAAARLEMEAAGADLFFEKPFVVGRLIDAVRDRLAAAR